MKFVHYNVEKIISGSNSIFIIFKHKIITYMCDIEQLQGNTIYIHIYRVFQDDGI